MAELEMDLNVPLLQAGLPEQMPMRFRKLLDPAIPISEEVRFEEHLLHRPFELRLLLISLIFFVCGFTVVAVGIAGLLGWITVSLALGGLIVLLGLAVLLVGAGFLLSSKSVGKLRREQQSGNVRLGNFYCKDALLQNQGNYVVLVPKNLILRFENKNKREDNEENSAPFVGWVIYKGSFDRECRLKLGSGAAGPNSQTLTLGDLRRWAQDVEC